jgi:hypothetical protein
MMMALVTASEFYEQLQLVQPLLQGIRMAHSISIIGSESARTHLHHQQHAMTQLAAPVAHARHSNTRSDAVLHHVSPRSR